MCIHIYVVPIYARILYIYMLQLHMYICICSVSLYVCDFNNKYEQNMN